MALSLRGRLGSLLWIERPAFVRFVLSSVLAAALPMVSILLLYQFLAEILGAEQGLATNVSRSVGATTSIWVLALLLLATFVGSAVVGYHNAVVRQRLVRTIELRVMERVVRHLLTLSVLAIDKQSPGDILETVRQDISHLGVTIVAAATILLRSLTAVALIASAIWLSPWLAAVAFPILFLAAIPLVAIARGVRHRSYGFRRRAYRTFDVVLQMLRGIRIIKIYRGEEAEAQRAAQHMRQFFDELVDMTRAQAMGQVSLESLGALSVVIIVLVGGLQVLDGSLTWPALLAFLMAVRAAQGPLFEVNSNILVVQRHVAAVDRLEQVLSIEASPRDSPAAAPFAGPITSLAFDGVSFCYESATPLLVDVSFEVSQGDVLGIVGPSGAGKTTILGLAARFFDPVSGSVRINNEDARSLRLADLYAQIAIVTQEPFLFSASIRDNIRCGRPGATDDDVEAAAQSAEIHDDIRALPDGYDTLVGTGNRGLSGGQIQRINIARAILKNAPLLLLDEATSSLDSIAEARVQRALARLMQGRTTLVIAHRLSTLRDATRILVLKGGRVAGLGTHDELLGSCALYRQMWNAQMRKGRAAQRPLAAVGFDG